MLIVYDGWVEIEVDGKKKKIGIKEMYIEEDVGKNIYIGSYFYVDLNWQGMLLIEIVFKVDIVLLEEVVVYLEVLC